MKKVAILQSNYIPWKGYFDIIGTVDEFILYDDVQYTKNDWRNRNLIKTSAGLQWLTIPVRQESLEQKICETTIAQTNWARKHWNAIGICYGRAPFFRQYRDFFAALYLDCHEELLSRINYRFLTAIADLLKIKTRISWSMDYQFSGDRTERLVDLCRKVGATAYLSGPAARDYLNEQLFRDAGIGVSWMSYAGYPEYPQAYPPFVHGVSIVDLIMNTGPDAEKYFIRNSVMEN